jgi:hypothetical protein
MKKGVLNKTILIATAIVLAILLFLLAASTGGGLPRGTTVVGVDVSGKSVQEAIQEVKRVRDKPKITLTHKGKKKEGFIDRTIKTKDLRKSLEKAKKDYSVLERVIAKRKEENIEITYNYKKDKLRTLFQDLERKVERSPREARVSFSNNLRIKPGRLGTKLSSDAWQETKKKARSGSSLVLLESRSIRPRFLNKKDIFRDSPVILVIRKNAFTLLLYKYGKLKKEYPIAIGKSGFATPSGDFRIVNKAINPAWNVPEWGGALAGQVIPGGTAENPLINRWLGIVDGVGIHGTREVYSLGSAASHGCIRMDPDQVISLYDQVPLNSRVIIR